MATLSARVRETLKDAGVSRAQWIKIHGNKGTWTGDECGCSDDRCIGYHHDELDECECLPAMMETYFKGQRAIEGGKEVWTAHLHALETGTLLTRKQLPARRRCGLGPIRGPIPFPTR